jgi:predicted type IV restriction endonuclease
MIKVPAKVVNRISNNLKRFQANAKLYQKNDVSEADTVTLVKDILSELFGFDKYKELTSEYKVNNLYVDLAVKVNGKVRLLIEVKSSGIKLNSNHLRQAMEYAYSKRLPWIVLTNGIEWQLHRVTFSPIVKPDELSSFDLLKINMNDKEDQMKLFLLCREGIDLDVIDEYDQHARVLNKFNLAQAVLSDSIILTIRRDLRKFFPDIKIDPQQILDILKNEVLRREVIEGEKSKEAKRLITRMTAKVNKQSDKPSSASDTGSQAKAQ